MVAKKKGKKGKKKGRVINVDFTGVKSGGGASKVPEGEYLVKVVEVEEGTSEKSGKSYLNWVLEITEGKYKGKRLYHITSLQPQALFNLRNTLEACGIEVPESPQDINLDDLPDYEMGVEVEIEEYEGKKRSKVVGTFPAEELDEDYDGDDDEDDEDEDEDEDDEDEDEDEEDEDDEDEDEEDYEEMSLKELKALCKERGIKVPKKAKKADLIELLEEEDV